MIRPNMENVVTMWMANATVREVITVGRGGGRIRNRSIITHVRNVIRLRWEEREEWRKGGDKG